MAAVIQQRLEIYGLFTDVVVVDFCASNIRTHHPSTSCFGLRQNKGNHFAPARENFITKQKHTFLRCEFLGRNERESELDFEANEKNRLKIYTVNKICQTGQKRTFYVEILTGDSKEDFQIKIHDFIFKFTKKRKSYGSDRAGNI